MIAVTLYTRAECPLCDKAKAVILASGTPVRLNEVDIDGDATLRARYTDDVPVVFIEGAEAFRHSVDLKAFVASVAKAVTLGDERCAPCRGGEAPLQGEDLRLFESRLGGGWKIVDGHHLEKKFAFPDFVSALAFTNAVGAIAEEQGHHPDLHLAWGSVGVSTWTHKINGLSESDFVLAARIDRIETVAS